MRARPLSAALALTAASFLALPALAEEIVVPSGQPVSYLDSILDTGGPEGLTVRFRFLAPQIADGAVDRVPFETAAEDMHWLCENFALARLSGQGESAHQVIVTLTDTDIPFGEAAPEATQFFEAYRPEGLSCIWEGF